MQGELYTVVMPIVVYTKLQHGPVGVQPDMNKIQAQNQLGFINLLKAGGAPDELHVLIHDMTALKSIIENPFTYHSWFVNLIIGSTIRWWEQTDLLLIQPSHLDSYENWQVRGLVRCL
jgi:hypothetical protein